MPGIRFDVLTFNQHVGIHALHRMRIYCTVAVKLFSLYLHSLRRKLFKASFQIPRYTLVKCEITNRIRYIVEENEHTSMKVLLFFVYGIFFYISI